MANEVILSTLERADSIVSAQRLLLLAERAPMPAHPAIYEAGDVANMRNNVIKVARDGLDGYNLLASATEIASTANTAFTDASTNVTVGRYYLGYYSSGLATGTDDLLKRDRWFQSLAVSAAQTEVSVCTALATSLTTTVGSVTSEMSLTTFLSALSTLEVADVPGPYLFSGHTAHIRGLRLEQLLSVGGQMQYRQPGAVAAGSGYKGQLFDVDVFATNRTPTESGGYAGMMAGFGAILRAQMGAASVGDPSSQIGIENMRLAYTNDESDDLGRFHCNMYVGYAINDATRAVEILTKA